MTDHGDFFANHFAVSGLLDNVCAEREHSDAFAACCMFSYCTAGGVVIAHAGELQVQRVHTVRGGQAMRVHQRILESISVWSF